MSPLVHAAHEGHESHESCEQPAVEAPGKADLQGRRFLFRLAINSLVTLIAIVALQLAAHRTLFADRPDFLSRYGWWIPYLDLSVVALVANLGYLRSYVYAKASHMIGMVIGMTIGMQVGTMIGGVVGATNGFFIGSIVGMSLGSLYGVVTAWSCGPMAVMHGLMAGVMGGTMGAMVVVMMIPDHVLIFMPIFTTVNLLILMWFTYLFHSECVRNQTCPADRPFGLPSMMSVSLLTVGLLSALMVAGPKGPMVWKGHKRMAVGGNPAPNPFSAQDVESPSGGDASPGEMLCGAMMPDTQEPPR